MLPSQSELQERVDAAMDWVAARTEAVFTTGPGEETHRIAKCYPAFPIGLFAEGESTLCDRVRILGCSNASIKGRDAESRFGAPIRYAATAFLGYLRQFKTSLKSNLDIVERSSPAWVTPKWSSYDTDEREVEFFDNNGDIAYRFLCTRVHGADGVIRFQVRLLERSESRKFAGPVSLWVGYSRLFVDVNTAAVGSAFYVDGTSKNSSMYYTRTMTSPSSLVLAADDSATYQQYATELSSFLETYWSDKHLGLTTPYFGITTYGGGLLEKSGTLPDHFMFSDDMWYDVNQHPGCPSGLPLGLPPEQVEGEDCNFSGHFGTSKVNLSVVLWEHMTTRDPLYLMPTAVHLLNRYEDPDHEVAWPSFEKPWQVARVIQDLALTDIGMKMSPNNVAKYVRDIFWNEDLGVRLIVPTSMPRGPRIPGINLYLGDFLVHGVINTVGIALSGMPVVGVAFGFLFRRATKFVVDFIPEVARTDYTGPVYSTTGQSSLYQGNSLRTAGFAILATLLGYKYNVLEWRKYADRAIEILCTAQLGFPPYKKYEVFLEGFGARQVCDWYGAIHGNWVKNEYGHGFAGAEVSPIRTLLFTPLNVVEDSVGTGGAVTECVPPLIQAFRVYLKHKYGVDYPTATNLP